MLLQHLMHLYVVHGAAAGRGSPNCSCKLILFVGVWAMELLSLMNNAAVIPTVGWGCTPQHAFFISTHFVTLRVLREA